MRIGGLRPPGGRWRVPGRAHRRGGGWRPSTWHSVLVAVVLVGAALALQRCVPPLEGAVRVVDGDSLTLDGTRIRLSGIDAPELRQSCGAEGATRPCGQQAKQALERIIAAAVSADGASPHASPLSCRPVDEDRYQRTVAVCSAQGQDVAAQLVAEGWAVPLGLSYRAEASAAQAAGRGIWSGPFERPTDFRERARGR